MKNLNAMEHTNKISDTKINKQFTIDNNPQSSANVLTNCFPGYDVNCYLVYTREEQKKIQEIIQEE